MTLGSMYQFGRGVPQEYAAAVKWFGKTADQGYAHAQLGLGYMHEEGLGVPQNYVLGVQVASFGRYRVSRYRTSRTTITQSSTATMSPRR
jgi:TPR repeat protein